MGYLKYVKRLWQKPQKNLADRYRELLLKVRREPVTIRLDRPTRIDRARSIGYKPKNGVIVVRQRVIRGGKMNPDIKGGRRSAHSSQHKVNRKSYQRIAEERVATKYRNCEVLNSYKVIQDGKHFWFEVILLDRMNPEVLADARYGPVVKQRGRAFRGLTSAGRKTRGLRNRGLGTEKIRPSRRANKRLH